MRRTLVSPPRKLRFFVEWLAAVWQKATDCAVRMKVVRGDCNTRGTARPEVDAPPGGYNGGRLARG